MRQRLAMLLLALTARFVAFALSSCDG